MSPDHLDALVWGVHELFVKDDVPDYSMFTNQLQVIPGVCIIPPGSVRGGNTDLHSARRR